MADPSPLPPPPKINFHIDLGALAQQLDAKAARDISPHGKKLLADCAEALRQSEVVLRSVPTVIENKRAATVIVTSTRIAAAMAAIAQQHEDGTRPMVTAQTALREFAGSLMKGMMNAEEVNAGRKPPPKRSKLLGMG